MPTYILKCPSCGKEIEFRGSYILAKHNLCDCTWVKGRPVIEMEIQIKPVLFKIKGKPIVID